MSANENAGNFIIIEFTFTSTVLLTLSAPMKTEYVDYFTLHVSLLGPCFPHKFGFITPKQIQVYEAEL